MYRFENHTQWPVVKEVCQKLVQGKFKAYLAGGCVRDSLMNRSPVDFDIATDAKPEEIQSLFDKTLDVGKKYGIIHVVLNDQTIEVATLRKDGLYVDGRHPESIEFATEEEDAARRDFTINAMLYDFKSGNILDYHGGQSDIQSGLIRCVGEPRHRFTEDYLRILRGVRFSVQLGFDIDSSTWTSMFGFLQPLEELSKERVQQEWIKTLKSSQPEMGVFLFNLLGYLPLMMPSLREQNNITPLTPLLLSRTGRASPSLEMRLASLYYQQGESHLKGDLEILKFPKQTLLHSVAILQSLQKLRQIHTPLGHRIEVLLGEVSFMALSIFENLPQELTCEVRDELEKAMALVDHNLKRFNGLPPPLVTGDDLKQYENIQAIQFGKILKQIYWHQLENPGLSKPQLLQQLT